MLLGAPVNHSSKMEVEETFLGLKCSVPLV